MNTRLLSQVSNETKYPMSSYTRVVDAMSKGVDVSYHDMDVDALHMFVDNVNQGLPYEYALETMRINELS